MLTSIFGARYLKNARSDCNVNIHYNTLLKVLQYSTHYVSIRSVLKLFLDGSLKFLLERVVSVVVRESAGLFLDLEKLTLSWLRVQKSHGNCRGSLLYETIC